MYARLRPKRSPILLPMRMNAAETSASSAIAAWMALTSVPRSSDHRRDRDIHDRRVDDEDEHRHRQQDGEQLVALRLYLLACARTLGHPVIASGTGAWIGAGLSAPHADPIEREHSRRGGAT